jgi:hypothetical protein
MSRWLVCAALLGFSACSSRSRDSLDVASLTQGLTGSITAPWSSLGPAPLATGNSAGNVSGRPWTMAVSPNVDGLGTPALFLGIDGGGIWRSVGTFTNSSPTWQPLTTSLSFAPQANQIGLSNIGALAVDPFLPSVIYAASGDPSQPGAGGYGGGLLKSVNGGVSWSFLGTLSNQTGTRVSVPGVNKIFVDPAGPLESCEFPPCAGSRLFANGDAYGTQRLTPFGIYRSDNSGITWTEVETGLPASNVIVTDLDYLVNSPTVTVLMAGVIDASGSNPNINGIWTSVVSSGVMSSWQQMGFSSITDFQGATRTKSEFSRIKIASQRTQGGAMYALITHAGGGAENVLNAFKLTGGSTWTPTAPGLYQYSTTNTSGMNVSSASSIAVAPDGSVYVGGVNAPGGPNGNQYGNYRSTDGGNTWVRIDDGPNGVRPHTDQHSYAFWNGKVYAGNDGGVYRFDPSTSNWSSLNTSSLSTILSGGVAFTPTTPSVVLTGSQDNGIARRTGTGTSWSNVSVGGIGDGAIVRFDPHDATAVYATNLGHLADPTARAWLYASFNGGTSWGDYSPADTGDVPDFARLAFHMNTAGRMATGTTALWESVSRGITWSNKGRPPTCPPNGPSVPGSFCLPQSVAVTAIAYGGGETIHVGWETRLFRTTNDGADQWPEPNPTMDFGGQIRGIAVDRQNTQRIYLVAGGHVWKNTAGGSPGSQWTDIASSPLGNFPAAIATGGFNEISLRSETSSDEPLVFVASEFGAWVGQLIGSTWSWSRLGTGLPDTDIRDIGFNPITKVAYAASYGRGVWASYLSLISDAAPGAAAAAGPSTYVFAKDLDGRILSQHATYGGSYLGWNEVQGTGRTNDAIAAAFMTGPQVFFGFVRGLDNNVYGNQATLNGSWGIWNQTPGVTTDAAPAAAASAVKNQIYVFAKGTNQHIFQNHATYGGSFVGWTEVPGGGLTPSAVSAAILPQHDVTFLVCRGLDSAIWTNQGPTGTFGSWSRDGRMTTNVAPAITADDSNIYWFATSTTGHIMMSIAPYGGGGSAWTEVSGGLISNSAPSAAILSNGVIFLYAKDTTGRVMVNQGFNGNFSSWGEVVGLF